MFSPGANEGGTAVETNLFRLADCCPQHPNLVPCMCQAFNWGNALRSLKGFPARSRCLALEPDSIYTFAASSLPTCVIGT
jgi:hypothetical protein